jgi:SPP1 gp7 family putative phage head morphogenesis protein
MREFNVLQNLISDQRANDIALGLVGDADRIQKARFEKIMANTLGVNVAQVIDAEGIAAALDLALAENVSLIKSIPAEQFGKIERAVIDNFSGRNLKGGTLRQEIQRIGKVTKSRAKLIARDQSEKMNAAFNEVRQNENGIKEYIWRTAQDERVVGTPGGEYPDGNSMHGNHYVRDGKPFRWDSPPADGHPGQPINCRCVAEPIIDRETLEIL